MIRRPPRSTLLASSAESDVYKRQIQGSVQVRRHHSRQWFPAQINLPLYPGDSLRVGHDGLAVLWLSDGTMRCLKAGSRWTVPHPTASHPSMWQELWASLRRRWRLIPTQVFTTVAAARNFKLTFKGVTILFPRNSRILNERPLLDWHPFRLLRLSLLALQCTARSRHPDRVCAPLP